MTTVTILADKANLAGLVVKKQIKIIENGIATWIDDKGADPVALSNGEATSGDFANDQHRFVVELAPPPDPAAPLPKSWLQRAMGR